MSIITKTKSNFNNIVRVVKNYTKNDKIEMRSYHFDAPNNQVIICFTNFRFIAIRPISITQINDIFKDDSDKKQMIYKLIKDQLRKW